MDNVGNTRADLDYCVLILTTIKYFQAVGV